MHATAEEKVGQQRMLWFQKSTPYPLPSSLGDWTASPPNILPPQALTSPARASSSSVTVAPIDFSFFQL
ncbi:hypothetical protein ZWY2020_032007 [Hordeum vulgare]|nr:hypothetical protein ZWY2020_032007 [Hordeum vulgare]